MQAELAIRIVTSVLLCFTFAHTAEAQQRVPEEKPPAIPWHSDSDIRKLQGGREETPKFPLGKPPKPKNPSEEQGPDQQGPPEPKPKPKPKPKVEGN